MARITRRSRRRAEALAATARTVAEQAQGQAAGLAERVLDSDAVEKAAAKGAELAGRAREWVREADLDERTGQLVARVRDFEPLRRATAPLPGRKQRRKRRVPLWMGVLAGLAAGYGIAKVAGGGSQRTALNDEFVASAERLAASAPPPETSAAPAQDLDLTESAPASMRDLDAPDLMEEPTGASGGRSLADLVRSHLSADPRTADLPGLAINVAEGTVFVRGTVPEGFEESTLREVISSVPGVTDVDLQVTVST